MVSVQRCAENSNSYCDRCGDLVKVVPGCNTCTFNDEYMCSSCFEDLIDDYTCLFYYIKHRLPFAEKEIVQKMVVTILRSEESRSCN